MYESRFYLREWDEPPFNGNKVPQRMARHHFKWTARLFIWFVSHWPWNDVEGVRYSIAKVRV